MAEKKDSRRDILKKGAAFTIPTIATFHLSTLKVSASGNNGWGNGDQDAPGGSLPNNGAENDQTP